MDMLEENKHGERNFGSEEEAMLESVLDERSGMSTLETSRKFSKLELVKS